MPDAPPPGLGTSVPPPPPPPDVSSLREWRPSRRDLFLIIMGGGFVYWAGTNALLPFDTYRGPNGTTFVKGDNGMVYQLFRDKLDRQWMVDVVSGTAYMDTGTNAGFVAATRNGSMYAIYPTREGKIARRYIGQTQDLMTVPTKQWGLVTGFPSEAGLMPPNAPLEVDTTTGQLKFPSVLDEGVIELKQKSFVGPYDKSKPDPIDARSIGR
ncbi:unnamed protein product [Pedinophyceae sp. YPF-701]|nr:unnamed protein product [Pedinophyceae sp. YPF-701]